MFPHFPFVFCYFIYVYIYIFAKTFSLKGNHIIHTPDSRLWFEFKAVVKIVIVARVAEGGSCCGDGAARPCDRLLLLLLAVVKILRPLVRR